VPAIGDRQLQQLKTTCLVNIYSDHKVRTLVESRARICKRLWSPGIDSASLCRLAGQCDKEARQGGNRFLGSLKCLQLRAQAAKFGKFDSRPTALIPRPNRMKLFTQIQKFKTQLDTINPRMYNVCNVKKLQKIERVPGMAPILYHYRTFKS
jgi:hypothetical protein